MTIQELIDLLEVMDNKDARVIVAKDAEGNSFSPLSEDVSEGHYDTVEPWDVDVEFCEGLDEVKAWVSSEEGSACLVLWPLN